MGFLTASIVISSKVMSEALLGSHPSQVLILTPYMVPFRVHRDTTIPLTSFSSEYLPRLPILMPCPGPHWTSLTESWVVPCPMETQSSPVPMCCWIYRQHWRS